MTPILLAPPAIEPVSLAEAKEWLRVDGNDEDELLSALIVAARLTIESHTRRFLVTQIWRMSLDAWLFASGAAPELFLPFAPFQRVAAIRVLDGADVPRTIDPAAYVAPPASDGARIRFKTAPPAPGRSTNGIEIDAVAGYGDRATDIPEPLRRAILMAVAHWHENRGDQAGAAPGLPPGAAALASPFRRERLR